MKNNWIRRNLTVILIACVMWSFFVMLAIRAHGQTQTGPFCSLCQTVQLSHMTDSEWYALKADLEARLAGIANYASSINDELVYNFDQNLEGLYLSATDFYAIGSIDEGAYSMITSYLDSLIASSTQIKSTLKQVSPTLAGIQTSMNDVVLQSTEYCTTCTASGTGGEGGTCSCDCPDYTDILNEISSRVLAMHQSATAFYLSFEGLKEKLLDWRLKWIAQDEKLTPILEELSPWLEKSKKFFSEYYDSDWGSGTWMNLKNIISEITEKETVKKLDRVLSDYVGSSMSSASWSALDYCLGVQKEIYDFEISDTTGKGVIKEILKDYGDSVEFPVGQSYQYPSEIPDEKEWLQLNWFQRITAALGVIAFSGTNIAGRVDIDFEEQQQKVEGVLTAVGGFGDGLKTEINGFYTAYTGLFTTFKGLFPADQFPTSLRLHPGFKFEYNPTGEAGGGQSNYVLPPWDWMLSETPLFKTAMDMARAIFGLCWWLLGAGILYEVIHGVYSMIVGLVGRVLVVVGSMGRAGGAGLGGD